MLTSVSNKGTDIPLTDGPVFVSQDKKVKEVNTQIKNDGSIVITTVYEKKLDSVIWQVQKNGLLDLKVAYSPANSSPYAGISFSFPEEEISGMKWMGQGPYRVWKNRNSDTDFGIWEKQYNQTITGHSGFEYPEFKGYHSDVYWAEIKTRKTPPFKVYINSNDIYLRMLTPDFSEDGKHTTVKFPAGDISFLHGISAIGTKFKKPNVLGPQSGNAIFSTNAFHGEKLRLHLVFDFN